MKKTYWWRVFIIIAGVLGIVLGYIMFYPYKSGICSLSTSGCVFSALKKTVAEPLFILSISIFITSIFLFFFSDKFFIKWFRFALIWFFLAIVFIAMAPTYTGGWMSFGPTKESVSIWMSVLFVIVSFGMFIREWMIAKK